MAAADMRPSTVVARKKNLMGHLKKLSHLRASVSVHWHCALCTVPSGPGPTIWALVSRVNDMGVFSAAVLHLAVHLSFFKSLNFVKKKSV